MRLQRESTGEEVIVSSANQLGAGGEARILSVVSNPSLAAKLYHRPEPTQSLKLSAMLANPPDDPALDQSHISIAWPIDRLMTSSSDPRFVGYIMPRVTNTLPLFQYYNPASRRRYAPLFNYQYLLRAARNLAAAVRALHVRGYVIGDLNESNILVTSTALVTLVDTDSFQVPDFSSNTVHRCTVGKPEYTPPEIQGRSFAEIDRKQEHDLFGLAILLFQLLMEGTHPYAGEYLSSGEPPPYFERISSGRFPYGSRRSEYRPAYAAPPIDLLHPTIGSLMLRCFEDGIRDPGARPDAQTWMTVLQEAEQQLTVCTANTQHSYGSHLTTCPWCERKLLLAGRDPFPSRAEADRELYVPMRRSVVGSVVNSAGSSATAATGAYVSNSVSSGVAAPPHLSFPPRSLITLAPVNAWGWSALVFSLAGVVAYQAGAPWVSIGCAAAFAMIALTAAAARLRRSGAWIAAICVPPTLLAATDSSIDIRAVHHPPSVRVIHLVSAVRAVAFSHDGRYIFTGTNRAEDQRLIGGEIQEWDLNSGQIVQTLDQYSGSISSISVANDSKSLAVASYGPMTAGRLDMIDARYPDVRTTLETTSPGQPTEALSPDGHHVAVGALNGSIDLLDIDSRQVVKHFTVRGEVLALAFAPNSKSIAVASGSPPGSIISGAITVFRTDSGVIWSAPCHGNAVLAVAFSPNGATIITGGNDSWLREWDTASGKLRAQHEVPTIRISTLAFSPNGKLLATAVEPAGSTNLNYNLLIYDCMNWRPLHILKGHTERVTCLAISPDARTLASGGLDATLRLWRLSSH